MRPKKTLFRWDQSSITLSMEQQSTLSDVSSDADPHAPRSKRDREEDATAASGSSRSPTPGTGAPLTTIHDAQHPHGRTAADLHHRAALDHRPLAVDPTHEQVGVAVCGTPKKTENGAPPRIPLDTRFLSSPKSSGGAHGRSEECLLATDDEKSNSSSVIFLSPPSSKKASAPGAERERSVEPELTPHQNAVLTIVTQYGRSVFLTGGAGTGKSFLLRAIIDHLDKSTTFVTAPTGVAALNIGGMTIHTFAGIGKGEGSTSDLYARVRGNPAAVKQWKNCRVLIIDEISMMPPKLLDSLESIARRIRGLSFPFGGIQLVFCGDFLQLPPVGRTPKNGEPEFCFESTAWSRVNPRVFVLRTVFRQQGDAVFQRVLNELRRGRMSAEAIHTLMCVSHSTKVAMVQDDSEDVRDGEPLRVVDSRGTTAMQRQDGKTVLRARNDTVTDINNRHFHALPAQERWTYVALDSGTQKHLLEHCAAEKELQLKVGARVMLLKNVDVRLGLVNGTVGTVVKFIEASKLYDEAVFPPDGKLFLRSIAVGDDPRFPVVRFPIQTYHAELRRCVTCDRNVVIAPCSWTVDAAGREVACRRQVPLRLAWAITIHKSQGMTLENVNVDFDGMFADGQAYVALSRCMSLKGLTIENFDVSRVRVSLNALAYYEDLETQLRENGGDEAMYALPTMVEDAWGSAVDSVDQTAVASCMSQNGEGEAVASLQTQQVRERRRAMMQSMEATVPFAVADSLERETVELARPFVALIPHSDTIVREKGTCSITAVQLSHLKIPLLRIEDCYVLLETSSALALSCCSVESPALKALCEKNFVCVPTTTIEELASACKRPHTAAASRQAMHLLEQLTALSLVAVQSGVDRSMQYDAVVREATSRIRFDDVETEADRTQHVRLLCYAYWLQMDMGRPVVVCTEDCILGLKCRLAGVSCTLVSGTPHGNRPR